MLGPATHTLQWTVKQYNPITADIGDTLVFEYSSDHNVYELPAGMTECPTDFFESGRVATLRGETTDSPVSITLDKAGVFTFACEMYDHCERGQIVTVTVGNTLTRSNACLQVSPLFGLMAATLMAAMAWRI